jgi:hypothetical protein
MTSTQQNKSSRQRTKSSKKSLLIRLSESCNLHRKNCHEECDDEHDMDCNTDHPSPRCLSDMKDLRSIIPMIEASCLGTSMKTSGNEKREVASRVGTVSAVRNAIDPKEVNNLCLFYISVVECTYCPFAMELLFDHGRGGVESE